MFVKRNYHFKQLDSSSTFIKRRRSFLKNLTFVSCEYQTEGHGRLGRTWHSTKGENLLFSFLIKDIKLVNKLSGLSCLIGVCVLKTLNKLNITNAKVKWPNDVYVGDKKIAGILLESFLGGSETPTVIVGVGINVNQNIFNGDYLVPPTSLNAETNKIYKIKKVKKIVYKTIKKELALYKKNKSDYLKFANQNNYLLNKSVFAEINGKKENVIVKNINEDNTLNVVTNDTSLKIFTGEITFHV